MTELKTLAAAIAANADLLERQRGVPFSVAEKLTNIAERLEELADEIQVNHEVREENEELRAQVEVLRAYTEFWMNTAEDCAVAGTKTEACEIFEKAILNKTPAQCLASSDAEIKAQAVEEFKQKSKLIISERDVVTGQEIFDALDHHINQLRQHATKAGE